MCVCVCPLDTCLAQSVPASRRCVETAQINGTSSIKMLRYISQRYKGTLCKNGQDLFKPRDIFIWRNELLMSHAKQKKVVLQHMTHDLKLNKQQLDETVNHLLETPCK